MENNKNLKPKSALTLIELITVMVIVSILVVIAMPNYFKARDKALNRQAQAIMLLIRAAERAYKLNIGNYYPISYSSPNVVECPEIGGQNNLAYINGNLSLDLVDDGKWSYCVNALPNGCPATSPCSGFKAQMTRYKGGNPYVWWWINNTNVNATCGNDTTLGGTCEY